MHKAKACILMCMDFRLQKSTQKWLGENGYLGECDEVIVAGASRDLVKPLEDFHRQALLRQLDLSVKLHDPDEIVIIDHQDCGGYAQDKTIEAGLDKERDKQEHLKYASEARIMLEKIFPGKTIKVVYAPLEGEVEVYNMKKY